MLVLLVENAGRVLTRDTLIDRVWGTDYVGDTKTLDVHIKRLRTLSKPTLGTHDHHHGAGRGIPIRDPRRRRDRRRPARGYTASALSDWPLMISVAVTPFGPARLGPSRFETAYQGGHVRGISPRGQITDALVDFHRRVGAGGAAMTTVAYLAVSPEGRTDRHCVYVHDDVLPGLRRLTDAVHDTGAAVAAQLGHAGPVANPRSNRSPALAPSRHISPLGTISREINRSDIDRVTARLRARGALGRGRRLRQHRGSPGSQLPIERFLEPQAQPPPRPVGWQRRESRPLRAPGRPHRSRGRG